MSAHDDAKPRGGKAAPGLKADRGKGAVSALSRAANEAIGKRLEAHYRALAAEPLPERFMVLLAELRAKELDK